MQNPQEHINKLFQNRILFEKKVLNVHDDQDRAEIVKILAVTLVRDVLKKNLNFLYIENLSDFSLKQIINILFQELANEWIDYAIYELKISKETALEELRQTSRITFIRSLSHEYYKYFNNYIFEEVADTFIELLVLNSEIDKRSVFINAVINSKFIVNRSVLNINSSDQLCKCAKSAKGLKDEEIRSLKEKISEIQEGIINPVISVSKREDLSSIFPLYEKKLKETLSIKLEHYDNNLQRVKIAIMASLKLKDT